MADAGPLSAAQEALVRVSAALATRDEPAIRLALRDADAAEPAAVDEVILQAHLFVGFPDALNALLLWRQERGSAARPLSGEDAEAWEIRGAQVCERVYGSSYAKLRENVAALHPDLDRWMVDGGYGRVIGRPGLDLVSRELCIAALLAVWNTPRQLHSHLRGALNVGAPVEAVDRALEIAGKFVEPERRTEVQALWRQVRDGVGAVAAAKT